MKTEPIKIASQEDMDRLAATLGFVVTQGPGARWTLGMEGRDEQRYELVFEAVAQPLFVRDVPIKPVVSLSFQASKVVE